MSTRTIARDAFACACGRPKNSTSAQCWSCYNTGRRGPALICEWCKQTFRRFDRKNPAKDARRFCSKRCGGLFKAAAGTLPIRTPAALIAWEQNLALRRAASEVRREERRHERKLLAQERAADRQAHRPTCACGEAFTRVLWNYSHPYMRRWCEACFAQEFYAHPHICPNCGQDFYGEQTATYCSRHCAKQMRHKIERSPDLYVSIGNFPLTERNNLAALIALMRAANRRLYTTIETGEIRRDPPSS